MRGKSRGSGPVRIDVMTEPTLDVTGVGEEDAIRQEEILVAESQMDSAPEINMEEGVESAADVIKRLLQQKDIVAVAIWGASTNVGKTHFQKNLLKKLIGANIPTICRKTVNRDFGMSEEREVEKRQSSLDSDKLVIIIGEPGWPLSFVAEGIHNTQLAEHTKNSDFFSDVRGFDAIFAIHISSDRRRKFPFPERVAKYADVFIDNPDATIK